MLQSVSLSALQPAAANPRRKIDRKALEGLAASIRTDGVLHTLRRMPEKDVGLRIRVEKALRDAFVEACQANHITAAQVLRTYMRDYIAAQDQTHGETNLPPSRRSRSSASSPRTRQEKGR